MKIRTNLALYPAVARRRSGWLLALSLLFAVGLSATHALWAFSGEPSPAQMRGETELLAREAAALSDRLATLHTRLDPVTVSELADRVEVANDFIARDAIDPIGLLALLESTLPEGLLLERVLLASSREGLGAELTLRAGGQADFLRLISELDASDAVHDLVPVSEQLSGGSNQIVLSLRYLPPRFESR